MMNILLSVITPVYNREDCVGRCIESVIKQQFKDYEHIIINDGSKDNTSKVIRKNAKNDNIIIIEYENNRGVNYARNVGIESAKGSYILFLDSDDTLKENALLFVKDIIQKNKNYRHFLFKVSDREYDEGLPKTNHEIYFRDWLSGKISGDFTHVVSTEICKKYLFYEQFIAFEHLNWLRILKEDEPQYYVNTVISQIDRKRTDSLTKRLRLLNLQAIEQQYKANDLFIKLFYQDFKAYGLTSIYDRIKKNILLGISLNKKKFNINYINILKKDKRNYKLLSLLNDLNINQLIKMLIIYKSYISNKILGNR